MFNGKGLGLNPFWGLQGVLLSVPETMEDLVAMKRLWVHEVLRVYYDRLVDDNDRNWLINTLHEICKPRLSEDLNKILSRIATPGLPVRHTINNNKS